MQNNAANFTNNSENDSPSSKVKKPSEVKTLWIQKVMFSLLDSKTNITQLSNTALDILDKNFSNNPILKEVLTWWTKSVSQSYVSTSWKELWIQYFVSRNGYEKKEFLSKLPKGFFGDFQRFVFLLEKQCKQLYPSWEWGKKWTKSEDYDFINWLFNSYSSFYTRYRQIYQSYDLEEQRKDNVFFLYPEEAQKKIPTNDTRPLKGFSYYGGYYF